MAVDDAMVCGQCGRRRPATEFYSDRDGERFPTCKECLCAYLDPRRPDTFMWILEELDFPWDEAEWVEAYNRALAKHPTNLSPRNVLGYYLRRMNMSQWRGKRWSDSPDPSELEAQIERMADVDLEELERARAAGEMSEAEFLTRTQGRSTGGISVADRKVELDLPSPYDPKAPDVPSESVRLGDTLKESAAQKMEESVLRSLDPSDYERLVVKWGTRYTPLEWVQMESLYDRYAQEYELNTDREETLKKICKTSLKMDKALDAGDMMAFQKLSSSFESLRRSGRFTEAQQSEERREIDSVGEMVRLVEREGGPIPPLEKMGIEYSEDKVDFTIRDFKRFTRHLVSTELGLGDLIESYVSKLENRQETTVDEILRAEAESESERERAEDGPGVDGDFRDSTLDEAYRLLDEYGVRR